MMELISAGFASILNPYCLLLILLGVLLGIVFGAIPGLSATMAIALCLPLTYGMALYIGGISGGLVSAILLRIPGTASSVATCFDGHPLAAKGEAGKALGVGIFYSFLGTIFGLLALMGIAPSLSRAALKFHTYEYFSIGVFSISLMCVLVKGSTIKGLAVGFLGMSFAMVGTAPIDGLPRLTFGNHALDAGFDILPVLIGVFAVTEILDTAEKSRLSEQEQGTQNFKIIGLGFTFREFVSQIWNSLRSAVIGTAIGILPGIGGGTANIISYTVAKNSSKDPDKFGTGVIDGIVASETANSATIGGALIPLLTLGIPGDTVTAMLLGALMIQGLAPGPLLFDKHGVFVYGIFAACLLAALIMIVVMYGGIRVFARILKIPKYILLPIVFVLCAVGAFGLNSRIFDVWCILLFGIIAYLLQKANFSMVPIVLGFILENIIETNLRRGLMQSKSGMLPFFTRPISMVFLSLAFVVIAISIVREISSGRKKKKNKEETPG